MAYAFSRPILLTSSSAPTSSDDLSRPLAPFIEPYPVELFLAPLSLGEGDDMLWRVVIQILPSRHPGENTAMGHFIKLTTISIRDIERHQILKIESL